MARGSGEVVVEYRDADGDAMGHASVSWFFLFLLQHGTSKIDMRSAQKLSYFWGKIT